MMSTAEVITAAFSAFEAKSFSEAEVFCRHALREIPNAADALHILGCIHSDRGDATEAARLHEQTLFFHPQYLLSFPPLVQYYSAREQLEDLVRLAKAWTIAAPNDPEAQHLLTAVSRGKIPERCSDQYVERVFNKFAHSFDQVLTQTLAYRGPKIIAAAFDKYRPSAGTQIDVLDAGCGTGLCGAEIRPSCRTLVGVDLAEQMIRKADERGCYDELVVSEICSLMKSRSKAFDAVVSGDVLIYFGALEPFFHSARDSLRPGGFVVATTESLPEDATEPYRLLPSGRYGHRKSYVADAARKAGLEVAEIQVEFIRWEFGRRVMGHCVVALRSRSDV
jgi:predicted TPR repeat methyltransferase